MASRTRYMIGRHFFYEMDRAPIFSGIRVTYAVAVNTDGASIFKDADRGELFQIRTMVDASGELDVRRMFQFYHQMMGGIYMVRYDFQIYGAYLVDNVQPFSQQVLKLIPGLRRANPTHIIECAWTLYPIRRQFTDTRESTEQFVIDQAVES